MRSNIEGARIDDSVVHRGKSSVALRTTTATPQQLSDGDPDVLVYNPGTTPIVVRMPAATALNEGRRFLIYTMGGTGGTVTLHTSAGVALAGAAAGVLPIGTGVAVVNVAGVWRVFG